MLRFTKRADYGLMAIHYIAIHEALAPVSAKRIAEQFHIPPELLAKILQRLAKRGLISSQNGPKGGYVLAQRPTQITVGDVIRALEGPVRIVSCMEEASDCPQLAHCNLRRPVQKLQAAMTQMLDSMSLAELTSDDVPEMLSIGGARETDRWR
jgi:Rrf2 family protein